MEAAPFIEPELVQEAAPQSRRRRRRVAAAALTAVATALTVAAALLRQDSSAASTTASLLNIVTHCPKSTCYECTNGNPGVPKAYANGEWGNITGDWYVMAQNAEQSEIDCDRFRFLDDTKRLHEEQLYYGTPTATESWFNVTSTRYDDTTGMWLNEHTSDRAWSAVWLVGTYKGSRYFGWYHCGDIVGFTRRGEAFVMKDDLHWDDKLLKKIEKKMRKAGLLDAAGSSFSEATQEKASCDYSFPAAGL